MSAVGGHEGGPLLHPSGVILVAGGNGQGGLAGVTVRMPRPPQPVQFVDVAETDAGEPTAAPGRPGRHGEQKTSATITATGTAGPPVIPGWCTRGAPHVPIGGWGNSRTAAS